MAAYEIPGLRFSAEAGAAVARRRFVTFNAAEKGIQATADSHVVGASMIDAAANEVLEIADGIVMVEAAAAIDAGAPVSSDAEGKAAVLGTVKAGLAVTSAKAAGELISVLIK